MPRKLVVLMPQDVARSVVAEPLASVPDGIGATNSVIDTASLPGGDSQ
jgi:hypothetical protein